jgi:AcrR family transcriptional regulator
MVEKPPKKREPKELGRRARERLARRAEILSAARTVFSARGYQHASLDEIARQAEFAKGTLYSYFGSKADLFVALIEQEFDGLLVSIREALAAEAAGEAATRRVIYALLSFFEKRNDFFRNAMAIREAGRHAEAEKIRVAVMRRVNELAEMLGRRFSDEIRAGTFKEYDVRFIGFLLLGIVHYYSVYRFRSDKAPKLSDGADMIADIFLDGVRH